MIEKLHTEGPWNRGPQYVATINGHQVNVIPIYANGAAIGAIYNGTPRGPDLRVTHWGDGNADIVQAAPDLYAALEAARDALNLALNPGDRSAWQVAKVAEAARDIARAALARAEGQAP